MTEVIIIALLLGLLLSVLLLQYQVYRKGAAAAGAQEVAAINAASFAACHIGGSSIRLGLG